MSTSETGPSGGSVTLDQLIALNDEMMALVRAGVPLERGLIEAGRDLRGRIGEIATDLGNRLGRGERLAEALAQSGRTIPDVYRAVVEAGLRSGRLAQALEGMAAIARGYADARRSVGLALIYPLIVLSLAYVLGVTFIVKIAPKFLSAFESLGLPPLRSLVTLSWLGDSAIYWAPILPALVVLLGLRWVWSGRSVVLDSGALGPVLDRLPLVGSMSRGFRAASFADLLALLIEHRVPLDESVRLAGEASGDRSLRLASAELAESIRNGEDPETSRSVDPRTFPPLLAWMLTSGRRQGNLSSALRQAAQTYRRRAERRADLLRSALPTVLLLGIGASAVLIYTLLLFVPLTSLLEELAIPVNQ